MKWDCEIAGVSFQNPVIAASGTYGFGREFAQFYDIGLLGGISVKGLTLKPRQGNAAPRIAETPAGMLNAVGLQNPGIDHFIAHDLPWLAAQNTTIIANIAGNTVEEYVEMARRLQGTAVDMIELNISCPNVKHGGIQFGVDPAAIAEVTAAVKSVSGQPLMVKLSPNVSNIAQNALAAQQAGADALSLINTLTGMAVDLHTRRPLLANVTGGLSGPAIKPVALRMVYEVCQAVDVPVVGMGGIMNAMDVAEFMLCGARAVMVGTANIANPLAIPGILKELEQWMCAQGIADMSDWVGALERDNT